MAWTATQMLLARLASIGIGAAMVYLAVRRPTLGRISVSVLFLWAGVTNWQIAHENPRVYLEYADLTYSRAYREFILGFFSKHILEIVSSIALAQIMIALLGLVGGTASRIGYLGATLFLVMIAPLGVGSGFPATILMAVATARLLRAPELPPVYGSIRGRRRRRAAA